MDQWTGNLKLLPKALHLRDDIDYVCQEKQQEDLTAL